MVERVTDPQILPDERYGLRLVFYDNAQLLEERRGYDVQVKSFEVEVQHLWDVLEMVYQDSKFMKGIVDYADLAKRYRSKIRRKIKAKTGEPLYEDIEKSWDEISFIKPGETEVERMNRTYLYEKDKVKRRLILMRERLDQMYEYRYPIQRRVMEERMAFLDSEFQKFDYMINPYHIQPGLLLDVDITSIKRKKATLNGMAGVLNEFLHGVSKGFQDAAFASFSRRRSTVREDIAMSFGGGEEEGVAIDNPNEGSNYVSMLNEPEESAGVVDAEPKPAKSSAKKGSRSKAKGADGLTEI